MFLSELKSDLREKLGNPSTTGVTDTKLTQLINRATRQIADRFRFHNARRTATFSTVSGTARYYLPSDCLSVMLVRDTTNDVEITKKDEGWRESQVDLGSGKPTWYVRSRNWVEFFPTPDAVIVVDLEYKGSFIDMAVDSDIPTIPEPWHEGISMRARWIYYDNVGDVVKALASLQSWKEWLADKPVEVDEEKQYLDSGISLPTLRSTVAQRDFNQGDF